MNQNRIKKVLHCMHEEGIDCLLISDAKAIHYLLGYYNEPGERLYTLVLTKDNKHKLVMNTLFFLEEDLGINIVWYKDSDDSIEVLKNEIQSYKTIGIDKSWEARFLIPLQTKMSKNTFCLGSKCIDLIRMVKDINEQVLMMEASKINDQAMHQVIKLCATGLSEQEVANKLPAIYQSLGASGNSFTPMIAYGANGANPHHENDGSHFQPGDSIIIDMGCIFKGYCSDMTRTVFYQEVSKEAKFVYNLVRTANEEAEKMIKPGVRLCDIDKVARDIISDGGYGNEFTHRLGHFIGIDVHEYGDVSSAFDMEIEEGMIFSIEPGVYLPNQFGVRIEDLVLVTKDGCQVLNTYPKDLFII